MNDFSSSEALSKFESWRECQTSLRLIMRLAGIEPRAVDAGIVTVVSCSLEMVTLAGVVMGAAIRLSEAVEITLSEECNGINDGHRRSVHHHSHAYNLRSTAWLSIPVAKAIQFRFDAEKNFVDPFELVRYIPYDKKQRDENRPEHTPIELPHEAPLFIAKSYRFWGAAILDLGCVS
jgi:hypothetical protein